MPSTGQAVIHSRFGEPRPAAWAQNALPARADELQLSIAHDLAEVEAEWRRFEQVADCTPFQSFDWLSVWQRHVGAHKHAKPVIVLGRGRNGDLVFLIPLATYRKGLITELGFLGRDLCDYNAPLLAPGAAAIIAPVFAKVWRAICERIQREPRGRYDLIVLDKMPARIGNQPNPFLALSVHHNPSGAYLTALSGDWETFYSGKRSSSTRRRDRTKRKRLAENGEVRTITPHASDDIASTLAVLIDQKQRSLARMGVANMFARPGYCAFFHDLATNPRTHDFVHVSRLQVGSTVAATNLGLVFRGGYYHVLASYDDGPLSKFGPGAAHLHDLMRYAIERGCAFFDFTIGDEGYKRDWSDTELALYDHIAGVTLRGQVVAGLLSGVRRVKRGIKQSERLWPLVLRLRARLAGLRRT